jgi:DNA repair protein RecN (Recombination protein N)
MLQELAITDFAIIQAVRLRFTEGLVIFTGETGAGKSIVLDAIGALLGERAAADVVRSGAPRAIVEGIFTLPWPHPPTPSPSKMERGSSDEPIDRVDRRASPAGPPGAEPPGSEQEPLRAGDGQAGGEDEAAGDAEQADPRRQLIDLLREYGLEGDDDSVIVTREIAANGRSVARVNGRAVPVSVLARLGALLVDVHGQGAHLSLLHPEQHVNFLDRYAGTLPEREALAQAVRAWQGLRREAAALRRDERELERRAELLRYQVDEISAAGLHPGEIAELEQERTVLANTERLGELALVAHAALAGADDGETAGALDLLNSARRALGELARIDTTLEATLAAFDECRYQLEDIAATVRDYRERVEADPARLAAVEERLDRISRLRRKYGATIEEILAYGAEAAEELGQIEHRDERIADLDRAIARQREEIGKLATALSARRQAAAGTMSAALEAALDHLNMRQARFFVQIEQRADPEGVPFGEGERVAVTPTGVDRVEFLIAPNPGEPPRPLARIASGGETSRLMLALKTILAGADATPTLIFDEIDAGISGLTGQIVGEMLWHLAQGSRGATGWGHQVICVTHLPQLAAFGDQHYHVAKRVVAGRTSTVVTDLDAAARTLELAQMLGGVATESAARNAAELLDRAAAWKAEQAASGGDAEKVGTAKAAPTTNGHDANSNGKAVSKKRARQAKG